MKLTLGLSNPKGSRWRNFSLDEVRAGKIAERSRVFPLGKIWENPARIFCLSLVKRPERSESLQGVSEPKAKEFFFCV
ncbi:MAG: hypothetical protein ACTSRI_16870 [Promethearchaeota archaeon]